MCYEHVYGYGCVGGVGQDDPSEVMCVFDELWLLIFKRYVSWSAVGRNRAELSLIVLWRFLSADRTAFFLY